MEERKVINNEIVITTKEDLAPYVDRKKKELEMFGMDIEIHQNEIKSLQERQNKILAELESIVIK